MVSDRTRPAVPDTQRSLPRIALTMGDPAGIGPELVVRAAADATLRTICRVVAVGHPTILQRAIAITGEPLSLQPLLHWDEQAQPHAGQDGLTLACWNPCSDDVVDAPIGAVDARCGRAAFDCLIAAASAALAGQVDAVTTAPLNKEALKAAGLNYPGHTEILGEVCGVEDFGMMLYLPHGGIVQGASGLGVVHETLHTSIRSVPDLLTIDGIASRIRLMDAFLRRIGCERPRVAVCALNPHGGENGLFGDEEARIIQPAVQRCRVEGLFAVGPLPADTLLRRAVMGEFDGVVAMYHDQGHIALKLIGFDTAANITLGLPIVRTSPSHGTAFDIAWQGRASAVGMIEAVRIAAGLATYRPPLRGDVIQSNQE